MQGLHIGDAGVRAFDELPASLPPDGFVWLAWERPRFAEQLAALQGALPRWGRGAIVDLHVSDLLNAQLVSHFDYTTAYDFMVFRRLAAAGSGAVDSSPIGFVVFDGLLITVHPPDCPVQTHFQQRLTQLGDARGGGRLPTGSADLMLRMVNHIVDSYLDQRRLLSRELGALQQQLLAPKSRFHDWRLLLDARDRLHLLEDTCEDQRAAVQEWIDALAEWPPTREAGELRERELLRVRSRDVLEHIERVLAHVRRLEQSLETAVQMHFAAQSQRASDIMRTLTVLTAVFLPLNLITGFFGMNFDALPLIHQRTGVWITVGLMALVAVGLGGWFWRKRYLGMH